MVSKETIKERQYVYSQGTQRSCLCHSGGLVPKMTPTYDRLKVCVPSKLTYRNFRVLGHRALGSIA